MAKLLTTNSKELTNFTEYQNTFKRQGAYPLDAYSVFTSLSNAENYAETHAAAYVGQTLVVANNGEVKQYIIVDTKGTLQLAGGSAIKNYDYSKTKSFYISKGVQKIRFSFILQMEENKKIGRVSFIQFGPNNTKDICYLGTEKYGNKIQGEIIVERYGDTNKFLQYKITEIIEDEEESLLGQTASGNLYFTATEELKEFSNGHFEIQQLSPGATNWTYFDTGVVQIEETFSN